MGNPYHHACLILIRGINTALEQMEREEYDVAKKTLLDAWDEAARGGIPKNPPLML